MISVHVFDREFYVMGGTGSPCNGFVVSPLSVPSVVSEKRLFKITRAKGGETGMEVGRTWGELGKIQANLNYLCKGPCPLTFHIRGSLPVSRTNCHHLDLSPLTHCPDQR